MVKTFIVSVCVAFMIFGSILLYCDDANAFRLDKAYGRQVIDVNKRMPVQRDNTCWLASFSVMITIAVNGNQDYAERLYTELVDHFGNEIGTIIEAWDFIMKDSACGAEKYMRLDFFNCPDDEPRTMLKILGALYRGTILCLCIERENVAGAHALTVYGLDKVDNNTFTLHYVDSDDGVMGMQIATVKWTNGVWRLMSGKNVGCYISQFSGINIR